jgi:hypothetical protein
MSSYSVYSRITYTNVKVLRSCLLEHWHPTTVYITHKNIKKHLRTWISLYTWHHCDQNNIYYTHHSLCHTEKWYKFNYNFINGN